LTIGGGAFFFLTGKWVIEMTWLWITLGVFVVVAIAVIIVAAIIVNDNQSSTTSQDDDQRRDMEELGDGWGRGSGGF
jgi:hypothetical protein